MKTVPLGLKRLASAAYPKLTSPAPHKIVILCAIPKLRVFIDGPRSSPEISTSLAVQSSKITLRVSPPVSNKIAPHRRPEHFSRPARISGLAPTEMYLNGLING